MTEVSPLNNNDHLARHLRVLMVCHMPWRKDLGASRVQIELAEELRAMGHTVDKFSWEDAVAAGSPPRLATDPFSWFSTQVHRRIASGPSYDIIDAHQGCIQRSKKALGFDGSLIVRSAGSYHFYTYFERRFDPHSVPGLRGFVGRRRALLSHALGKRAVERSFDVADRIVVHNLAEHDFLQLDPGWGLKVGIIPAPISTASFHALKGMHRRSDRHAELPTVSFLGSWHPRKGSRDWPKLAGLISEGLGPTQFRFLGTGTPSSVIPDEMSDRTARVRWVTHYRPEELPGLLRGVQVGAFPSYLEGFGIAVVEQLAAGIPVVAYDVPGPRDILSPIDPSLLIRPGDVAALAKRVVALLTTDARELAGLHERCLARAGELTWDRWTAPILEIYSGGSGA